MWRRSWAPRARAGLLDHVTLALMERVMVEPTSLTVKQLKKALEKNGVKPKATKPELISQLKAVCVQAKEEALIRQARLLKTPTRLP